MTRRSRRAGFRRPKVNGRVGCYATRLSPRSPAARRIAGKTGIMGRHKLTTDDEDDEGDPDGAPMFQGALLAIPMALCFAFLRYSVRNQFRVWEDYSFGGGVKEALAVYACSAVLVAVVAAYKDSPLMKALLGIAATACGCAMVKATEIDRTYGAAMTTPGLAVLWIYCIARGTLGADAVSLALTLLYYATNGVRKIPFT
ncbi:hypothetical protein DFJ74DRAFT_491686 [Hyaloraphidium curvatum]|nr:hypothetical protein DFJ74DRAFT_491686 [Hyaloraphidium curvatum]